MVIVFLISSFCEFVDFFDVGQLYKAPATELLRPNPKTKNSDTGKLISRPLRGLELSLALVPPLKWRAIFMRPLGTLVTMRARSCGQGFGFASSQ
jgi:hypothetical protein